MIEETKKNKATQEHKHTENSLNFAGLVHLFRESENHCFHFGPGSSSWHSVSIDSRTVKQESLYFGLQGKRRNGGFYLGQTMEEGASIAVIDLQAFLDFLSQRAFRTIRGNQQLQDVLEQSKKIFESGGNVRESTDKVMQKLREEQTASLLQEATNEALPQNFSLLVVNNALHALRLLSQDTIERNREGVSIVGITGSAGKTTTKNILYHLLRGFGKTTATLGNLNTEQGLALSILNTDWEGLRYAIFECGISEPGEMDVLADMLRPDIAVITNVGSAHLGAYAHLDQLREEKLKIAEHGSHIKALFVSKSDQDLVQMAKSKSIPLVLHDASFFGENLEIHDGFDSGLVLRYKEKSSEGKDEEFVLDIIGYINASNIYLALRVAVHLGHSLFECIQTLAHFKNAPQRYEIINKKPLIIDDSYNANLESMKASIEWFASFPHDHKIAVIGGIKELGAMSYSIHQECVEYLSRLNLTILVWVGLEYEIFKSRLKFFFPSNDGLLEFLQQQLTEDSAVIFKGSNSYKLGLVANQMQSLQEVGV